MPRQKGAKTASKPPQYRWLSVPRMRIVPELSLPRVLTQKSDNKLKKIDQVVPVLPPGGQSPEGFSPGEGMQRQTSPGNSSAKESPIGDGSDGQPGLVAQDLPVSGGGLSVSSCLRAQQYRLQGQADVSVKRGQHGLSFHDSEEEEEHDEEDKAGSSPVTLAAGTCEMGGSSSSEFMRRRRAHPRLRWPRLASRSYFTGAVYTASAGTGIRKEGEEEEEAHVVEDDMPTMAPPDSSFNGCSSVLGLKTGCATGFASEGSVSFAAVVSAKMNASSSCTSKITASSSEICETTCSMDKSAGSMARAQRHISRPTILPRARTHRPVEAGTSSTLNAPLPEDIVFSRPGTSEGRVSSLGRPGTSASEGRMSSLGLMTPSPSTQLSSLSRASSTASKASSCDRKWFMRVAPISCLPAERSMKMLKQAFQGPEKHRKSSAAGTVYNDSKATGDYLSFERWGLNDDYIEALLSAHDDEENGLIRLHDMKHLNLSENQLTERGIAVLMGHGMPDALVSLNLSYNLLRERGGLATVELLARCRHLIELNLEGNLIGDLAVEELCNMLDHQCPQLEGLGMARCNIGANLRGGTAIGGYLSLAHHLSKLDLHWNSIHGEGARALLKGVYANGVENSGSLTGLNLAWNRLGSGSQPDSSKKREAAKVAKLLSSVFQDGQTLFHLDLSYNGIDAEDCAVLAGGLLKNHTLFGIHLIGNEARLDDFGFVVPMSRKQHVAKETKERSSVGAAGRGLAAGTPVSFKQGELLQINMNAFISRVQNRRHFSSSPMQHEPATPSFADGQPLTSLSDDEVRAERKWIGGRQRVKPMLESTDSEAVQRNAQCCWICENWVEHKVTYTPGISGNETSAGEVQSVYALYSLDGYARPTHLSKQEEMFTRRTNREDSSKLSFAHGASLHRSTIKCLSAETQKRGSAMQDGSKRGSRKPVLNAQGRLERWVGIRMLPPSDLEPLEVVFVVNGQVRLLDDMAKKILRNPKTICLVGNNDRQVESVQVKVVNLVPSGRKAWEKFRMGTEIGLCIMEDPESRGEFTILPRRLSEAGGDSKLRVWTFETSTFKEYTRDCLGAVDKCFEADWLHTRVPMMVKTPEPCVDIYKAFREGKYLPFILTFWHEAFGNCMQPRNPVGVSMHTFRDFLVDNSGVGPSKVIDDNYCNISDPDLVWVAANVVPQDRRTHFKVLPEKGLARFQFFEALVRFSFRRYLGSSMASAGYQSYRQAIETLAQTTRLGQDLIELRQSLHRDLFSEDCCVVYKEYLDILKVVFEGYSMIRRHPGRSGKMMSFAAWRELLVDTGIKDSEGFTDQQIGQAFALGKEIRADEYSSWRYMELSWPEFLVAIGGVVRLLQAYKEENLPNLLDDFLNEYMEEAHAKVMNKNLGTGTRMKNLDHQMEPLVRFLQQLFQSADEDQSGTVDETEFRKALAKTDHLEEMAELGIHSRDIDMLFRTVDKDGSGDITLDELCDGFIKMKLAMRGEERAIQYIMTAFSEMDADESGTLDAEEFHELLNRPEGLRKLAALGVTEFDINGVFEVIGGDESGGVTVEQVIEGLLRLRDPEYAVVRGMRLLQQLFEEADEEGAGALTKAQVCTCFNAPEVVEKIKKLSLQAPAWGVLFEELDVDGSGDLSWEEIDVGMKMFWGMHY